MTNYGIKSIAQTVNGPIKKKEIGIAILKNHNNLKKIIKIVHPLVRLKMKKFLKKNKSKKMVVLDVPLLLENKIVKRDYILVFVSAKKNHIKKRIVKRKNYNQKIFNILKKMQLPLEIKKRNSHFIISNNFRRSSVNKNVKIIKKKILNQ